MNNKQILEAMSLDLKRVSLGAYQNSENMTQRFLAEVMKRKKHLEKDTLSPPVASLLISMEKRLRTTNTKALAEHALMYSTLFLSFAKRL